VEAIIALFLLLLGGGAPPEATGPDGPGAQPPPWTLDEWRAAAEKARLAAEHAKRGSSGIPMVEKTDPQPDAPPLKGLYATANSAGGARLGELLSLIERTELNALVIDVKNDYGQITYMPEDPELAASGAVEAVIRDPAGLIALLNERGIYPIARVVVFKDTLLARSRPDLSFTEPGGAVWMNGRKESFVNPYLKEVWEYNIRVARDAARLGFKEIQFDYVRFPEGFEKRADTLVYAKDERRRTDVITDFVKYAREQLSPLGVRISVDIFGYAASVPAAEGIGQDFAALSKVVDPLPPMVPPSHYSPGWFGSRVPDAAPYRTIDGAMKDTLAKIEPLGKFRPLVRPWIQDFTATWVEGHIRYGVREIEEQIRALKDNGIEEFLLWNSGNRYTEGVNYDLE